MGRDVSRATAILGVVAATAVGLGLRLRGLDRHGFWLDELSTAKYFARASGELASGAAIDPGQPPLYYILLQAFCAPGASDWALRLPSAIVGAATIPVAALLAAALFGRRAALAAAALVAASPFLVTFSQEARMYALLGLLSTAASLLAWRTLRTESRGAALAYVVLATATVLTHFLGAVTCLAHVVAASCVARSRRGLVLFLGAGLLAAAAFVALWGWHLPEQVARNPVGWVEARSWADRAEALAQTLIGGQNARWEQPATAIALAVVVALGAVIGAALVAARRRALSAECAFAALLVVVPVGGLLAVDLALHPMFLSRYLTAGVVPLLILIAAGAVRVPRAGALVVAALLAAQWWALAMQWTSPDREHWREAGAFVSARLEPGDVVLAQTRNCARYLPPDTRITSPWRDWSGAPTPRDGAVFAPRAWVLWEPHLVEALARSRLTVAGTPLLRERFLETEVVLLDAPTLQRTGAPAEGSAR